MDKVFRYTAQRTNVLTKSTKSLQTGRDMKNQVSIQNKL